MKGRGAVHAEKVCGTLLGRLEGERFPARLHSRFRSAANLETPLGLVTLLAAGRCLQPYAVCLKDDMDLSLLEPGAMALGSGGVFLEQAPIVSFAEARPLD